MAGRRADQILAVRPVEIDVALTRVGVVGIQSLEPENPGENSIALPPGSARSPVGCRLLNSAHSGAPAPIFSATENLPVGVLKLPGSKPKPNREVETGQLFTTALPRNSDTVCDATSTRNSQFT